MPGTASYQMYAWPETRAAAKRFWSLIRANYGSGDATLTWYPQPESAWSDPDLLLSQTCGLPFRYRLKTRVRLVGTLDYGVADCPAGYYRSCLVVRRDDARADLSAYLSATFARNTSMSQSGWAAFEDHLQRAGLLPRFRGALCDTGSHAASVGMVAEGGADLASIDAVTWRFLQRYDPVAQKLRVLDCTRRTPGLPLITGLTVDPEPLYDAVKTAIGQLHQQDRETLGLQGIARIAKEAYLAEPLPAELNSHRQG